jgi:hypothetical protein
MSAGALHYVYCIGRAGAARALAGLDGIEDGAPPAAIATDRAPGLVAVASEVPAKGYSEAALHGRLQDLGWAGEKAIRHERVVETCFLAGPVIPLRFCTIFESAARVEDLLARHAARLHEILRALEGCAEWALRAYLDRPRFEAATAARAAAAAAPAPAATRGRAYLEAKRAALLAREATAGALARALDDAHEGLARAALRGVRQAVPPVDASGDELVMKAAYLVPLAGREAFEAAAAALRDRASADGIALRLTGPWPPYSFVPPLETVEADA